MGDQSALPTCQACSDRLAVVQLENEYPGFPFELCTDCVRRIENLALRPVEWYRMAALFGPSSFLLHDDFYDEDGSACQPQMAVDDCGSFPAPSLDDVRNSAPHLVDYAFTRWFLEEPEVNALRKLDSTELLMVVERCVEERPSYDIEYRALEIAAEAIEHVAADWVRTRWTAVQEDLLFPIAFASARCLPMPEGFDRVITALAASPKNRLADDAAGLAWFRSEHTLDWMVLNVASPVVDSWGRLAAVSSLSWPKTCEWLDIGRPMNLVALDALNAFHHYNTPLLKRLSPFLLEPPSRHEFLGTLELHRERDPVPRVERAIDRAVRNANKILRIESSVKAQK